MSEMSPHQRREVLFHGRVQGVGFRYTTRHMAARFAVVGFVENLPDRRVRLVVEGAADEIERFVRAVTDELAGYIQGCDSRVGPASGEFTRFEVRR